MDSDFCHGSNRFSLEAGQEIQVSLHADLVSDEYVWRWETKISGNGKDADRFFRQSTFQGATFTPQSFASSCRGFLSPSLSEEGQANRWMLQAIDGKDILAGDRASGSKENSPRFSLAGRTRSTAPAELAAQFFAVSDSSFMHALATTQKFSANSFEPRSRTASRMAGTAAMLFTSSGSRSPLPTSCEIHLVGLLSCGVPKKHRVVPVVAARAKDLDQALIPPELRDKTA